MGKPSIAHVSDKESKAHRKKSHLSELPSWLATEARLEPSFLIPIPGAFFLLEILPSPHLLHLALLGPEIRSPQQSFSSPGPVMDITV